MTTTQEPVSQQAMRRSARRWAARLCAADVRYDEHADVLRTAAEFAAVMEQCRFLPQFFVRQENQAMVDCRRPQNWPEQQGDAYARPMEERRGVWFPGMAGRDHPLPDMGGLDIPPLEGRQPLLPAEGSALGAVNLAAHLTKGGKIDHKLLARTIHTAVHLLDNAIDVSEYDDSRQSRLTRATRRIGIGMMGLAEVLRAKGILYDSEKGRKTAQHLAKMIDEQAKLASQRLAGRRGPFPLFTESRHNRGAQRRNSAVTATAPNEVLAAICGVTPGISADCDVSAQACVKMQAAVQRYTEGNVYLSIPAKSKEHMQELCTMGYLLGCKSIEADVCEPARIPDFLKGAAPKHEGKECTDRKLQAELPPETPHFCPVCGRQLRKRRIVPVCEECGPLMCLQTLENVQ